VAIAIQMHKQGAPEVLTPEEVELGSPGPGEARLRQTAVGVNFLDTQHRSGAYNPFKVDQFPIVIGLEGAGTVEAVGAGVDEFQTGDRVAYLGPPLGAYASERLIPAHRLVRLPEGIDEMSAAGMMLKGLTANYLLHRIRPLQKGDTILVHAAAGGVGLLICQWAKHLGFRVIGTVGSEAKAAIAQKGGCDHVIDYTRENFASKVREVTDGKGVPIVYDGIGRATFDGSLDCLSTFGYLVNYGSASGAANLENVGILGERGSLFLTRPRVIDYAASNEDYKTMAAQLFQTVLDGGLTVNVNHTYALRDAATAHRELEARQTTGSIVLVP
jgi:NADPH:quinone reductase